MQSITQLKVRMQKLNHTLPRNSKQSYHAALDEQECACYCFGH